MFNLSQNLNIFYPIECNCGVINILKFSHSINPSTPISSTLGRLSVFIKDKFSNLVQLWSNEFFCKNTIHKTFVLKNC